jgi:diadenylate cyclase
MPDIQNLIEWANRLLERLNPFVDPSPLLDIATVAVIFYWLLGVIRGTRAVPLLRGIGVLLLLSILLGQILPLETLGWLLRNAIQPTLIVAIPVLFQPELRRALESLGRTNDLFGRPFNRANRSELLETINGVARAAQQLSQQGVGALMVIERETGLQEYADRGVILDSRLAVPLLLNIFYPNSPLHDMAVIVRANRILAANVVLPLSEDIVGQRTYGTRHRAAKGISEQSDAIAIVVSEETGAISLVNDGRMVSYLNEQRLRGMLAGLLKVSLDEQSR